MSRLCSRQSTCSYFTWDINPNSLQWLTKALSYLPDPFSFSLPSLLGSPHTGLFSVPWTQCAYSCLRIFMISISPSRNALPSHICRIFSFWYNTDVSLTQGATYSDYLISNSTAILSFFILHYFSSETYQHDILYISIFVYFTLSIFPHHTHTKENENFLEQRNCFCSLLFTNN